MFLLSVAIATGIIFTFKSESFRLFGSDGVPGILDLFKSHKHDVNIGDSATNYESKFDKHHEAAGDKDTSMVNDYYNIATDFFEYGWGKSFHFAHTKTDESHDDSISRHERRIVDVLGIKETDHVLDVGSGIGGPALEIARYSKAHVTGVTLNAYQIQRSINDTIKKGLSNKVDFKQMDFTKLEFEANVFDHAYACEATCHSPTLEMVYKEVFRVLKPGGIFLTYEWLSTKAYNPKSEEHKNILWKIAKGDGLPPIRTLDDALNAARAVGFEVVSEQDLAQDTNGTRPWYYRLDISGWQYLLTHYTCVVTEFLGMAPKGTTHVHGVLLEAVDGLVKGGKANIFTPMHMIVLRKPKV